MNHHTFHSARVARQIASAMGTSNTLRNFRTATAIASDCIGVNRSIADLRVTRNRLADAIATQRFDGTRFSEPKSRFVLRQPPVPKPPAAPKFESVVAEVLIRAHRRISALERENAYLMKRLETVEAGRCGHRQRTSNCYRC